jgi:hypothetical protein
VEEATLRHAVSAFYDKLAAEAQLLADEATSSGGGGGAGGGRKRRVSMHAIDMGGRTHFTSSERRPSSGAAGDKGGSSGPGLGPGADLAAAAAAAAAAATDDSNPKPGGASASESETDVLIRDATSDVHHAFVIVSPQRLREVSVLYVPLHFTRIMLTI